MITASAIPASREQTSPAPLWVSKGDIHNCFGKLDDSGKPALREPGILSQQLRASPLIPPPLIPL